MYAPEKKNMFKKSSHLFMSVYVTAWLFEAQHKKRSVDVALMQVSASEVLCRVE